MLYRNITDQPRSLPTATGSVLVPPGDVGATSPKFGTPAVEAGQFEVVLPESIPTTAKRSRRSVPPQEADS